MKHYILSLFLIFILASCNKKAAEEKLKMETTANAIAINRIVGIGKITPENDIIQLSSPVMGLWRKSIKKEIVP